MVIKVHKPHKAICNRANYSAAKNKFCYFVSRQLLKATPKIKQQIEEIKITKE